MATRGSSGANDGILSIASLILGVAAATPKGGGIMIAGIAGVVAGSMSMAAGEYVSVSSQADSERADLELEKRELKNDREYEVKELAAIYVGRGLQPGLATEVAEQLMVHDALGAHARDELGIYNAFGPKPVQAAFASAVSFAVGGLLPLAALLVGRTMLMPIVFRKLASVSVTPRRHWREDRWSAGPPRSGPRNFLGDAGNGTDVSSRRSLQHSRGLTGASDEDRSRSGPHETEGVVAGKLPSHKRPFTSSLVRPRR
jgi:vacuolar iron transporter family protein